MSNPRPVFKNARREVLHMLAPVRDDIRLLGRRWNVRGTVADGGAGRPRRDDEYPENSAEHWEDLAVRARRAAALLHGVAALADEELTRIRRRPQSNPSISDNARAALLTAAEHPAGALPVDTHPRVLGALYAAGYAHERVITQSGRDWVARDDLANGRPALPPAARRVLLTSAGHTTGIAARARDRAMAGPVPNHAVAYDGREPKLLCTGGPALAGHNGGGNPCPKCLALIAEQIADEDGGAIRG